MLNNRLYVLTFFLIRSIIAVDAVEKNEQPLVTQDQSIPVTSSSLVPEKVDYEKLYQDYQNALAQNDEKEKELLTSQIFTAFERYVKEQRFISQFEKDLVASHLTHLFHHEIASDVALSLAAVLHLQKVQATSKKHILDEIFAKANRNIKEKLKPLTPKEKEELLTMLALLKRVSEKIIAPQSLVKTILKTTLATGGTVLGILAPLFITYELQKRERRSFLEELHKRKDVPVIDVAKVTFNDIKGLDAQVKETKEILDLFLRPDIKEKGKEIRYDPSKGMLFYGPPGTGKTMFAKAIANYIKEKMGEEKARFFYIPGPSFAQKYVGDAEKLMRNLFAKAQEHPYAIIFIDEIDSFAGVRGDVHESTKKLLNQFLVEMDNVNPWQTLVIASTNFIHNLDPAAVRSGRFDKKIEIKLPNKAERLKTLQDIIKDLSDKNLIADDVNDDFLNTLADDTKKWSRADLMLLINRAKEKFLLEMSRRREEEIQVEENKLSANHFTQAYEDIKKEKKSAQRYSGNVRQHYFPRQIQEIKEAPF